MASEGCSTPVPTESSTRTPERSSTLAPAESSTPAPASSSTPAPPGSFTITPEGSSTRVPTESSTFAPAESSTFAPAESSTFAPAVSSSTPAPAEISTLAPTEISTLAPAGSSTLAPAGSSTLAPAGSSTLAPAGSSTLAPASSSTSPPPSSSTSAPKDCFTAVSSNPKWKEGLESSGSCLELYDLLQNRPELIHELGPDDITVLHKGVDHGCVKLVRFVLVDMFNEAGICKCRGEENGLCALTREGLLRKTDTYGSTAVNIAIRSGSPKMVLLLEWAIRVCSKDMKTKTVKTVKRRSHPVAHEQYGELLKVAGCNDERSEEVELVVNVVDDVPDVKDNEISTSIYLREKGSLKKTYDRDMQLELYKIIAAKLNERYSCEDEAVSNFLKEKCVKNVDFEFVPMEHIFLHFLISYGIKMFWEGHPRKVKDMIEEFQTRFILDIVAECKMWDEKNATIETMQMTLFSILDPRGRTIMHTLLHTPPYGFRKIVEKIVGILKGVASEPTKRWRCYTAKDGAGRTLYHMASIYGSWLDMGMLFDDVLQPEQYPHVNIEVTPLCCNEFRALQRWSFEGKSFGGMGELPQIPIYFAVLFDSEAIMSILLQGYSKKKYLVNSYRWCSPFNMASSLGRTKLVEQFLKRQVEFKNVHDRGFDPCEYYTLAPALHRAASCGQVEVLQMILKYPIYDPMCKDRHVGDTALHVVVGMKTSSMGLTNLKLWALQHVHPDTTQFKLIEESLSRYEAIKSSPRDFTKDEKICINLLLQAGIDVWTPNSRGEYPNVGFNANNEAKSWWYDKVVKEVEIKRASITSAANATSVIGALVATTSFIGPLQPPLSYSSEGYLCNNISFFFSIASILMAVLPSIPMPKESLFEEMIRSERCLKAAILFLLISIICILVSFSLASLAVVSSKWHDRKFIVASMVIGGGVCIVVLMIFIIRLLRMVFHKNSWLRRKFAKHMYF